MAEEKQENKDSGQIKKPEAECCIGCLKWVSFEEQCWVYWKGKKQCTMKAGTSEELSDVNKFIKIE